jgi:hypothetical protein
MKIPSVFTKAPSHKKFSFTPRYFDDQEEQRKEREDRIKKELAREDGKEVEIDPGYRTRISGSFRSTKKTITPRVDPSVNILRLIILLVLVVFLIAYLQFGNDVVYGLVVIVPLYLYVRLRKAKRS